MKEFIYVNKAPTKEPVRGTDPEVVYFNSKIYAWNRGDKVWEVIGETSEPITQGVEAITGTGVDNTDPLNPVINGRPYLSYVALVSQASSADPTVVVLENELSGAIVWTYAAEGMYTGTLAGAFLADKVVAFMSGGGGSTPATMFCTRISDNTVRIYANADGTLTSTALEIRVYP